jgi:hypothetical protein
VVKTAINKYGLEVWGVHDGYLGLIENRMDRLAYNDVSNILTVGGTILGTSRDKPHRMTVDGQVVDTKPMPKSLPIGIGWVETFNVGVDTGTSVDDDYQVPFPFTGKLDKLTVKLGPEELTPAEREMIYGTMRDRQ